jgi:LPXTG-motif cell wall-anchored protein
MRRRDRVVLAALAVGVIGLAGYLAAAPPAGLAPAPALPGVFEVLAPAGALLGLGLLGLGVLLVRRRRR